MFTKGKNVLTVPIKRPFLKSVYVRQALAVIEDMIDLDEQEGNKGVK